MERVRLEDAFRLLVVKNGISETRSEMQYNLKALNNAFDSACERWKDKNANMCRNALDQHNAEMSKAFEQLENIVSALARLNELAQSYEDID